jgi:hypothetical protein
LALFWAAFFQSGFFLIQMLIAQNVERVIEPVLATINFVLGLSRCKNSKSNVKAAVSPTPSEQLHSQLNVDKSLSLGNF